MLYRIGLDSEIPTLPSSIPKQVRTEITQGLVVLDCEYGSDRDYLESGGCSILIENSDDLDQLKANAKEHFRRELGKKRPFNFYRMINFYISDMHGYRDQINRKWGGKHEK